jgi:predicted transcriptional regulator
MTTDPAPLVHLMFARPPLNSGSAWGDRQRALLLELAVADPGIHVLRAAHLLGMNWNTCYHHVRRMAGDGLLAVVKVRGKLCLFDPKGGAVAGRMVHVLLRDARTASLAREVVTTPGLNQQDLAGRLGIAPSAAYRHLGRLQSAGLVDIVRQGRQLSIRATPTLRDAWLALERGDGTPACSAPPAQTDESLTHFAEG